MKKKFIPKYANGTGISGLNPVQKYLENPSEELAQNSINIVKAQHNAATNPWTQGMHILGSAAMNFGLNNLGGVEVPEMAFGGSVPPNAEVEGKEVGILPNNKTIEFEGPSHEQGGIKVNLPGGTDIFSKRIKIDDKTMAQREKERAKMLSMLEGKLKDNPTDQILKATLERVQYNNEKLRNKDKQIQEFVNESENNFAYGTGILGLDNNPKKDKHKLREEEGTTEMTLDGEKADGTSMMPKKFQGKYVHYAPTTMLNEEDSYHRTFSDLLKNFLSTKQSRQQPGTQLVTPEFALGGSVPDEEPIKEVETYEGADNFEDYKNYVSQKQIYDIYNNEAQRLRTDLGESKDYTAKEFNSLSGMSGFKLPEGATGVVEFNSSGNVDISPSLEGNYYSSTSEDKIYIPKFDAPEDKNYKLVDSPEVKEKKERQSAWEEESKGLQGYVRNTYYDPECNCNKTELVPLKKGLDAPTNGTFVPLGEEPPEDWMPKFKYGTGKYALGGSNIGGPAYDPEGLLDSLNLDGQKDSSFDLNSLLNKASESGITGGNVLGLAGNLFSTFSPLINTLNNRANDTPNVNYFENYGQNSLDTINEMKNFVNSKEAEAMKNLQNSVASSRRRNRNSARGVNTARALDLGTELSSTIAEGQNYVNFANMMSGILGQEANLESNIDQMVMSGERERDLSDRQDRDNFNTNLGSDLLGVGMGLQETGKDLNSIKQQETMLNLLNQLSKYGIGLDNQGNLNSNG